MQIHSLDGRECSEEYSVKTDPTIALNSSNSQFQKKVNNKMADTKILLKRENLPLESKSTYRKQESKSLPARTFYVTNGPDSLESIIQCVL